MMPSPIQLQELSFKRVHIEVDENHAPAEVPVALAPAFGFDGVSITTEFGIGQIEPATERGPMFVIQLRVLINNEPVPDAQDQKFSPYFIDVQTAGVVFVPAAALKLGPAHDLAAVNGAALLWSAIREQVLSVTSRMPMRQAMLPTVHFHDLKQGAVAPASQPAESAPKKAVRSRKSPVIKA
jgi:preprotein translocase subunit SecB